MSVEPSTSGAWVPDDSTFGARLALVRQRMQWGNVKEAAIACGLPAESWRTWERDGVTPRRVVEVASIISARTGCDYGWLLAGNRLRSATNGTADVNTRQYLSGSNRVMPHQPKPPDNRPPGRLTRSSTTPPPRRPVRIAPPRVHPDRDELDT